MNNGSNNTVFLFKVTPDGIVHKFAGNGFAGSSSSNNNNGDGGDALSAQLFPGRISIGVGTVELSGGGLREIDSSGTINSLTGEAYLAPKNDGIPAMEAGVSATHAALGPDGFWYIPDNFTTNIRKLRSGSTLPSGAILVANQGGSEIYQFDGNGRHLSTLTPLRGHTRESFLYDASGRLQSVTDEASNVTSIDYTHAGAGGYVTLTATPHGYGSYAHVTTIHLDSNQYASSIVNPNGEAIQLTYSSTSPGLLHTLTDAKGQTHTLGFDVNGFLTQDQNALPQTQGTRLSRLVGYQLDSNGAPILAPNTTQTSVTSPEGWTTTHTLNSNPPTGSPLRTELRTHINPLGLVTTDERRSDGSSFVTLPDGTQITTTMSADPRFGFNAAYPSQVQTVSGNQSITETMTRVVCPGDPTCPGNSTIFGITSQTDTKSIVGITGTYTRAFNAAASTVTTQTPEGRTVVATLDSLDRVTKLHIPGSLPAPRPTACTVGADDICDIQISYDPNTGRVQTVSQGTAGRTTTINRNYGSTDFVGSISSPFGSTQYTSRDSAGRPLAWTSPGSLSLQSTFDSNGNLASFTLPKNYQHQFTANSENFLARYLPPQVGLVLSPKDTSYTYDRDSLLLQLIEPSTVGGATVSYSYDSGTRLHGYAHPYASVTMGYDSGTGQLTSINDSATNGVNLSYLYGGSLPLKESYAGSGKSAQLSTYVSYKYDSLGRVTDRNIGALAGSGAQNVSMVYDNDGVIKTVTATDPGTHAAVTYTVNRAPTNRVISGATFGAIVEAYTYNEYGEVLTYSAKNTSGTLTYYSVTYTRDAATGRITSKAELSCPTTGTCSGSNLIAKTWSVLGYDAKNRLGTITSTPQTEGNWSPTYDDDGNINSTYTYDAQDRITAGQGFNFSYDYNGDTAYASASWGNFTYSYDPLGNLRTWLSSGNGSFDYVFDGLNRRVAKIAHVGGAFQQGFLYGGDRVIARLNSVGSLEGQYVYATKGNVPDIMVNAAGVYRIISDNVGNPRVIVSSTGTVLENIFFTAWGVPTPYAPTSMPFGFAGGLWDADLGLVRFGARDYGPSWGRWWSKDPIRMAGGYDLYAYCGDDPVNCIDPSGHWGFALGWSLYGGYGGGGGVGAGLYYDDSKSGFIPGFGTITPYVTVQGLAIVGELAGGAFSSGPQATYMMDGHEDDFWGWSGIVGGDAGPGGFDLILSSPSASCPSTALARAGLPEISGLAFGLTPAQVPNFHAGLAYTWDGTPLWSHTLGIFF